MWQSIQNTATETATSVQISENTRIIGKHAKNVGEIKVEDIILNDSVTISNDLIKNERISNNLVDEIKNNKENLQITKNEKNITKKVKKVIGINKKIKKIESTDISNKKMSNKETLRKSVSITTAKIINTTNISKEKKEVKENTVKNNDDTNEVKVMDTNSVLNEKKEVKQEKIKQEEIKKIDDSQQNKNLEKNVTKEKKDSNLMILKIIGGLILLGIIGDSNYIFNKKRKKEKELDIDANTNTNTDINVISNDEIIIQKTNEIKTPLQFIPPIDSEDKEIFTPIEKTKIEKEKKEEEETMAKILQKKEEEVLENGTKVEGILWKYEPVEEESENEINEDIKVKEILDIKEVEETTKENKKINEIKRDTKEVEKINENELEVENKIEENIEKREVESIEKDELIINEVEKNEEKEEVIQEKVTVERSSDILNYTINRVIQTNVINRQNYNSETEIIFSNNLREEGENLLRERDNNVEEMKKRDEIFNRYIKY